MEWTTLELSIFSLTKGISVCCSLGTKEEDDAEEDDEESYPVEDYDYGDYETATITSDTDLIAGGSLPIFLAEPVDTFVVKGKPATLHCRAAHALQVCTYCNNVYTYIILLFKKWHSSKLSFLKKEKLFFNLTENY